MRAMIPSTPRLLTSSNDCENARAHDLSPEIEIADLRAHNAGRGIGNDPAQSHSPRYLLMVQKLLWKTWKKMRSCSASLSPLFLVSKDRASRKSSHTYSSVSTRGILVMIYEDGLGQKSKWWNYLQLLPDDFDTLIYWSSSDIAELVGSAVLC